MFSQKNPLKAGGIQDDRRKFLVGSAAATGRLLIGFGMPSSAADAATKAATPDPVNAYVQIGLDNKVTIFASHMDKGQGAFHGLATLVIEELEADWFQIHVTGAADNAKLYGNLMGDAAIRAQAAQQRSPTALTTIELRARRHARCSSSLLPNVGGCQRKTLKLLKARSVMHRANRHCLESWRPKRRSFPCLRTSP